MICFKVYIHKARQLCKHIKTKCKKEGIPFDCCFFKQDNIASILSKLDKCPCCGKKMIILNIDIDYDDPELYAVCDDYVTVDRLIPEFGYVENNVRFICNRCNRIKSDSTAEELKMVFNWVKRETTDNWVETTTIEY